MAPQTRSSPLTGGGADPSIGGNSAFAERFTELGEHEGAGSETRHSVKEALAICRSYRPLRFFVSGEQEVFRSQGLG
jgi:hypothetical protein